LAQGLLPLAHKGEEPGDEVQVQGGIKTTYQETQALLLPLAHLAGQVTLLPSIKLFYLTPTPPKKKKKGEF
jgi:hypothetical protein